PPRRRRRPRRRHAGLARERRHRLLRLRVARGRARGGLPRARDAPSARPRGAQGRDPRAPGDERLRVRLRARCGRRPAGEGDRAPRGPLAPALRPLLRGPPPRVGRARPRRAPPLARLHPEARGQRARPPWHRAALGLPAAVALARADARDPPSDRAPGLDGRRDDGLLVPHRRVGGERGARAARAPRAAHAAGRLLPRGGAPPRRAPPRARREGVALVTRWLLPLVILFTPAV